MFSMLRFKCAPAMWLALAIMSARSAGAQILLTNVQAVNVTPSSFSIVATVSPAIGSTSNLAVGVFSDPGGVTNLSGQVGLQFYPLNSGNPGVTNAYSNLLSQATLQQDSVSLGLIYARVSYCASGTTYYYQITVTGSNGQSALWPPSGPLPAATTSLENSFVLQSQQLVVTLSGGHPPGSILTLANTNSSSVLAAVVGDGVPTNQAFFNVNDLIAASGGTNYQPLGSQLFTATVLGAAPRLSETYSLVFSNSFSVGQSSQLALGARAATVRLGMQALLAGSAGSVPVLLNSSTALAHLAFTLNLPVDLFSSLTVTATTPALQTASLTVLSSNTVQLSFAAAAGQNLLGSQQIAQLNFTTLSNQSSAIVPLFPQQLEGTNTDSSVLTNFYVAPGRIIIVGPQPVLDSQLAGSQRNLVLYGNPGQSYQIESSTNLANPNGWSPLARLPLTNLMALIPNVNPAPATIFFRAYQFSADPPILEGFLSGQNVSLLAYGLKGTNYTIQYANRLSRTIAWNPLLNYTLTNSFQFFNNIPNTNSSVFYRIKKD